MAILYHLTVLLRAVYTIIAYAIYIQNLIALKLVRYESKFLDCSLTLMLICNATPSPVSVISKDIKHQVCS